MLAYLENKAFLLLPFPVVLRDFWKGTGKDDSFQSSFTNSFCKESLFLQSYSADLSHHQLYKLAGRHIKYRSPYVNPFFN